MAYSAQKIAAIWLIASLVSAACRSTEHTPVLPYFNSADFTPVFLTDTKAADEKITHHIGAFSCTDQNNNTITDASVKGHIHVANFFFTECNSVCPEMNNNLNMVAKQFHSDSDVVFLSFSVTPWLDSVPALAMYASEHHFNNFNWHFLTGKTDAIYTLARQSYFAEEISGMEKDSTQFLHTEHILLVDKDLRIRGVYNGSLQTDMGQLAADIRALEYE